MSMIDLDEALELISSRAGDAHFIGARHGSLIDTAEAALGLSFPPTYRRFLSEKGCGDVAGAEFYGVVDENFVDSSIPDAIWLTLQQRDGDSLPKSLILISDTGDGGYYAIDTSRRNGKGESPVIVWFPGLSGGERGVQEVAEDFGEFMLGRVRDAVRSRN